MELNDLISKIEDLQKDILDYIENTEHYIFNWIEDKKVQDFIKEYPNEYEDMIYIHVIKADIFPIIRINFVGHPDGVEYIDRSTYLSTFRDTTKVKWLEWNGKVKEKQITEKEEQLEYYKNASKMLKKNSKN